MLEKIVAAAALIPSVVSINFLCSYSLLIVSILCITSDMFVFISCFEFMRIIFRRRGCVVFCALSSCAFAAISSAFAVFSSSVENFASLVVCPARLLIKVSLLSGGGKLF